MNKKLIESPYREIFENNLRAVNDRKSANDLIMTWFDQTVEQLLQTALQEQQDNWINVEDRLPKTDRPIIISGEGHTMIGFYYNNSFRDALNVEKTIINITHWQPLPTLPKQ